MVSGSGDEVMVMLLGWVAVAATLSVTFSVNEQVPAELGMPEITPMLATVVSASGGHPLSPPALKLQV
jgi:hypothetical protein